MRLYHYVSSKFGLENIAKGRLKIARLDECNDPFELWGCWQKDPKLRAAISRWKQEMTNKFGLLCFSRDWHNPLMWSHYADRHRGICLGFDVPEQNVLAVNYTDRRTKLSKSPSDAEISSLIYSKYQGWAYEKEWRSWVRLNDRDGGHYFFQFADGIVLKEVYVGAFSNVTRKQVDRALSKGTNGAFVLKTRLAFRTFSVVENREYRNRDWA
jgi:hypothetical protein